MTLPEDDVGAFEDFAEWLYARGVMFELLFSMSKANFKAALKLFVLADKYDVTDLKNTMTKHIFTVGKVVGNPPSLTEIAYIYAHTVQSSGIRKLFADWYAWRVDPVWFEQSMVQTFLRRHPDCATDLSVSLAKK